MKEYLITQYGLHKKSLRELGREFGTCHKTIRNRLNSYGIETFSKRQRKTEVEIKCDYCRKPIRRYEALLNKRNFCGYECYHSWMVGNTSGENGSNWKGGITAISSNNLKTPEFRALKKIVLTHFPICVMCGDENYLHVHHIKTRREYPELAFELENLITLCRSCHAKIKGKEKQWQDFFTRVVRKGGELLGTPNASGEGNQQPSLSNVINIVDRKVQRLTGEDVTTNKPDTSAAPERDDIVRAYRKL